MIRWRLVSERQSLHRFVSKIRRRRPELLQAEDSSIWRLVPGLVEEIGELRGVWFPEHRVSIAAVRPKILLGVLRDGRPLYERVAAARPLPAGPEQAQPT